MSDYLPGDEFEIKAKRVTCERAGLEPNDSCNKLESYREWGDPYTAAKRYIKKDPTRNCCTIGADNLVTQWQLKQSKTEVELKDADSGTTFYHHNKLKIEIGNNSTERSGGDFSKTYRYVYK